MNSVILGEKKANFVQRKGYLLKIYFWILSFLKPYKWHLLCLILCSISIAVLEMLIPKFLQYFIDVILPTRNMKLFGTLVVGLLVVLCILLIMSALKNNLQRNIRERAARDLQLSVFQKLRDLGFSYYENHPTGETLSLLNAEVSAVQQIYRSHFPDMVQYILFIMVMVGIMLQTNWKLALITIPSFLLYYLIVPYAAKRKSLWSKDRAQNKTELNKRLYDSFSALPEIRAYGVETWDLKSIIERVLKYANSDVKAYFYSFLEGAVQYLSFSLGMIILLIYGSVLVRERSISIGEYVAYQSYYVMAMGYFMVMITSAVQQSVLMYQAEKLKLFMMQTADIKEPAIPKYLTSVRGELSFQNVHFGYPTAPNLFNGFNLYVQPGEKIAIVGTSGNGKSTLFKLIGRFYDPMQGKICMDGIPINELSLSQLRDSIGFVFQENFLFGKSIKENIRFGNPDASDDEITQAAKAANAHEFIVQLADGYHTYIGERGIKLSGGQKQRIAVARMIVKNPTIILLDEATASLDYLNEREVLTAIDALMEGKTTLTIAHRISSIAHYDRIIVIDQGSIAESGNYEQLIKKRGIFYQLLEGESREEVDRNV
ncbi:MAG: hypothetical protein JWN30_2731 [Bacilli bacterium]|nr:hypothetical protein [Bacilli bacterium]